MEYQLKQKKIKAVQFKDGMKKKIPGTSITNGGRTIFRNEDGKTTLTDGDFVLEDGTVMSGLDFNAKYVPVKKAAKPKTKK